MMTKKRMSWDTAAVLLTLILLLAAGVYALLWPHPDFSDSERRYLTEAPGVPSLSAWKTDQELEDYLSDRVPFRPVLIGTDAVLRTALGERTLLDAWPAAGAILEPPVTGSPSAVTRRLEQFGSLAAALNVPWNVLVPETHGYLLRNRLNALLRAQYLTEEALFEPLRTDAHFLDVFPDGTDPQEVYYRTDHHWTLQGAYMAYLACCRAGQLSPLALDDFSLSRYPGFLGTTQSRSGLPPVHSDTLVCAEPRAAVRLTLPEQEAAFDRLIFPQRAETYDGYAVYLDGNHGMLEICNDDAPGGTLLVYKDSFANCLLPLLAANYSRIVAVDARYYAGSFSDAAAAAGAVDRLLFLYSLDSLVNDTAVARKAGP